MFILGPEFDIQYFQRDGVKGIYLHCKVSLGIFVKYYSILKFLVYILFLQYFR